MGGSNPPKIQKQHCRIGAQNAIPRHTITWGVCMKGRIYTRQKCAVCGASMPYDERRGGCFCPSHPNFCATGQYLVQFGRQINKRFSDIRAAERFLNLCRAETDAQKFDARDYAAQNPLGFRSLAEKWIEAKKNTGIRPQTVVQYRYFINLAIAQWGDTNIKGIGEPEIEDFLLGDILRPDGQPIAPKTRANLKSALHDFWSWVLRREKRRTPGLEMPVFPEIRVEMQMRAVVSISTQMSILDEIHRILIPQNRERIIVREALAELRERNTDATPKTPAKIVYIK